MLFRPVKTEFTIFGKSIDLTAAVVLYCKLQYNIKSQGEARLGDTDFKSQNLIIER